MHKKMKSLQSNNKEIKFQIDTILENQILMKKKDLKLDSSVKNIRE